MLSCCRSRATRSSLLSRSKPPRLRGRRPLPPLPPRHLLRCLLRHDREQLEPRNRNRPLRIALLRGSANSNADRLATLLSLRADGFSAHLFTTSLDAASVAALHDTLGDGRRHALRHTSLRPLTDADAAVLLSSFDVVLDASGHTAGNRLGALARRPAPVAASVLGFAGSYGGARLVDYLTADRLVTPPMVAGVARTLPCVATSERVVLLPTTYQPAATAMAARPYGKATRGAAVPTSSRGPLVGSFTRAVRWHPSSFGLWAEVLRRGPRARMWLLAADGDARAGAIAELRAAGVDARAAASPLPLTKRTRRRMSCATRTSPLPSIPPRSMALIPLPPTPSLQRSPSSRCPPPHGPRAWVRASPPLRASRRRPSLPHANSPTFPRASSTAAAKLLGCRPHGGGGGTAIMPLVRSMTWYMTDTGTHVRWGCTRTRVPTVVPSAAPSRVRSRGYDIDKTTIIANATWISKGTGDELGSGRETGSLP